jgi:hypothetical protein
VHALASLQFRAKSAILVASLALFAWPAETHASSKTVCTITVNSTDEREVFRRHLPSEAFQVVELVENGRSDWLDSACRAGVRCDVLVISGHFDGGVEFYSDRLDMRESLPMEAMERVACSESCPGLFSHLKEVYLFGCNTLNAEGTTAMAAEIERSLVRAGRSRVDAARVAALLNEQYARSNRDRMRLLFKDVPVIYGFSSKAPLGHVAGPALERLMQTDARRAVGSGRVNADLLRRFAPVSMTVASGVTDSDPQAGYRRDVCAFADERLPTANKAAFVHSVLEREMAHVRVLLDPIEKFALALDAPDKRPSALALALDPIATDGPARDRFLAYARDTDEPGVGVRMIAVAHALGWLSAEEQRAEWVRLLGRRLPVLVDATDVDLACRLNRDGALDAERHRLEADAGGSIGHAALLACLGDTKARQAVLEALTAEHGDDGEIARVLLHYRPMTDAVEFRAVAAGIGRMTSPEDQARAIDTLAKHPPQEHGIVAALAGLFPFAKSLVVQRAIAGLLIRSDIAGIDGAKLAQSLREHRIKSPDGRDVIDVLIRRLATL